jgi:hypothetical protein
VFEIGERQRPIEKLHTQFHFVNMLGYVIAN